jgi:Ca2+-binding RTX toxin-like protein
MSGGAGDDTYVVGEAGETLAENAGEGVDLVQSAVTWTLGANFENLTLTGTGIANGFGNALANTITGNVAANTLGGAAGNDTLDGGGGNDILLGGDGDDILLGGAGDDNMNGGDGNDTYVVGQGTDNLADSGGIDTVQSSVAFTLGAGFEHLTLTGSAGIAGTGNELDNRITGNSGANVLTGGAGDDVLNGGAGADRLIGGLGDDRFVFGTGDTVVEALGEGTDTMESAVTATLAANVENLLLTGTGAVNGTGNGLDNEITGNSANNTLKGDAGDDRIAGGAGNDTLTGGLGEDVFVFDTAPSAANRDSIADFVHGTDRIELDAGIYAGLSAGDLDPAAFRSGAGLAAAVDADDRILYNSTSGALLYDADGAGGAAAVQFAMLTTRPAIDATDFSIV